VHRLPRHPVTAGHLCHRRAVLQDFQHRPGTAAPRHPAPPAHPAPFAAISLLIAAKRHACGKPGNQFGVSPAYRNYCQPATGTVSANCRPGTRTKVFSIYRARTYRCLGRVALRLVLPGAVVTWFVTGFRIPGRSANVPASRSGSCMISRHESSAAIRRATPVSRR